MTISRLRQIVLASGNRGKINEVQSILQGYSIVPQTDLAISEAVESGLTFVENAIIKARHAAKFSNLPAIADDSGLMVDALDGAPGVFSARYAGQSASDSDNIGKLLVEIDNVPIHLRCARFVCVLVFIGSADDPLPIIAQGIWEGAILHQPVGNNGFGYDPVFWVPEYQCSAAELTSEQKNAASHRGKALKKLADLLTF